MTPPTIEVPCWNRRFVSEEEMRSLLNLKRPAWHEFLERNPMTVKPNSFGKYDREKVEPIFAKS